MTLSVHLLALPPLPEQKAPRLHERTGEGLGLAGASVRARVTPRVKVRLGLGPCRVSKSHGHLGFRAIEAQPRAAVKTVDCFTALAASKAPCLIVKPQLVRRAVGALGIVPRVRVRLEGDPVQLDAPQRPAEQPVAVRRQRRGVNKNTAAAAGESVYAVAAARGVASLSRTRNMSGSWSDGPDGEQVDGGAPTVEFVEFSAGGTAQGWVHPCTAAYACKRCSGMAQPSLMHV